MNSIISFPSKIANIGSEIDYHGNAVTQEIKVMHGIIDSHGKGIENEMQLMRESFENEMRNMQKKPSKYASPF